MRTTYNPAKMDTPVKILHKTDDQTQEQFLDCAHNEYSTLFSQFINYGGSNQEIVEAIKEREEQIGGDEFHNFKRKINNLQDIVCKCQEFAHGVLLCD